MNEKFFGKKSLLSILARILIFMLIFAPAMYSFYREDTLHTPIDDPINKLLIVTSFLLLYLFSLWNNSIRKNEKFLGKKSLLHILVHMLAWLPVLYAIYRTHTLHTPTDDPINKLLIVTSVVLMFFFIGWDYFKEKQKKSKE